jgi:hypothetical protein
MDGDPNDIKDPVNLHTATGALTYADTDFGQALALNVDGSTNVSYDASINTGEITIAAWLNPANTSDQLRIIFTAIAPGDVLYVYPKTDASADGISGMNLDMTFPVKGRRQLLLDNGNMAGYHHFVFSYDGNTMKIFVDGTLRKESIVIGEPLPPITGLKVGIPYPGWLEDNYRGWIDDLQLYNYGFSAVQAAQLYVDAVGGSICLGGPDYDLSGDCEVNLEDLAALAVGWLTTMDSDDLAGLAGEWLESGQLVE